MNNRLKEILKREKKSAHLIADGIGISPVSFRRMLRGDIKMDVEVFNNALVELGYKIIIVKKDDLQ